MIKIFEEYVEFRKSGEVFNFNDYRITKDNFKDLLRDLNDFLVMGEWYRIKFNEYKNVVIRLSGHHSCINIPEDVIKYYQRSFTINFDSQYLNGKIQNPDKKYAAMSGNGVFWFSLKNNNKEYQDIIGYAKDNERIYYYNWENNKNTIIEHLTRPNAIKNIKEDPYNEEEWEDANESKKKRIIGKIRNKEVDPYNEEDWGWDIDHQINDDDFKGKYIIFKLGGEFRFDTLKNHYTIGLRVDHRGNHRERYGISLNTFKRLDQYVHPRAIEFTRYLIPITEREIERIKKDRIQLIPYGGYHKRGINDRTSYSELKKDVLFLDQEYMDRYLYMNENKINEKFKVGDSVLCTLNKFTNLTGEIVFVDDSHFDSYTVKLDREIKGKLFYPAKEKGPWKLIDLDEREELRKNFFEEKEELNVIHLDVDPYCEEIWNESKIEK